MQEGTKKDATEEMEEVKPVLHGGEGDPLGAGVSEMEPTDEVSEGVPEQD